MTVQFEATAVNGQISVPIQYRDRLSSPITVIIVRMPIRPLKHCLNTF
jgi:hypothetical protein